MAQDGFGEDDSGDFILSISIDQPPPPPFPPPPLGMCVEREREREAGKNDVRRNRTEPTWAFLDLFLPQATLLNSAFPSRASR